MLYLIENFEEFVVAGSGKPLRQFIYSKDLAKLMLWALREYTEIQPIILSVDQADEISIKEVAQQIAHCLKFTGTIKVKLLNNLSSLMKVRLTGSLKRQHLSKN